MGSDILSYFRPFQDRECFDMKCSFIYYLFVCLFVCQTIHLFPINFSSDSTGRYFLLGGILLFNFPVLFFSAFECIH